MKKMGRSRHSGATDIPFSLTKALPCPSVSTSFGLTPSSQEAGGLTYLRFVVVLSLHRTEHPGQSSVSLRFLLFENMLIIAGTATEVVVNTAA
jgi:hypothetical protein